MLTDTQHISIEKDRKLSPAQDYYFLREQGLEYLRQLSGKLWTDHNAHDPGITMLEALCYALTDLGYRTSFPMEDLLVKGPNEAPGLKETGLFPAHEILPCAPLTINDYRKLLLKVEGIRNAWLLPLENRAEQTLLTDCPMDELTFGHLHYTLKDGPLAGQELVLYLPDVSRMAHEGVRFFKVSFGAFTQAPGTLGLGVGTTLATDDSPDIIELELELEAVHDDYYEPGTFQPEPGLQLIHDANNGSHTFQVVGQEGELLLRGEKYTSKSSRDRGVRSFQRNGPNEARWKRQKTADDRFFFTLQAGNNREIGRSIYYETAEEMLAALDQLLSEQFDLTPELHIPQTRIISEERQWTSNIEIRYRRNRRTEVSRQQVQLNTTFASDALPASVVELLEDPDSDLWQTFWEKQIRLRQGNACRKVRARGLYEVLLELEVHELFGSLNETTLYYRVPFGELKGVVFAINAPHYYNANWQLLTIDQAVVTPVPDTTDQWTATLTLTFEDGQRSFEDVAIQLIDDNPNALDPPAEITPARLATVLVGTEQGAQANGMMALYWQKQAAIHRAIATADCLLQAHRNLGEDFLAIRTVDGQQVGICVDIDVRGDADLEVLQAKIYLAIEEYLNPSLKYYTLAEMLEQGYTVADIFDGPYLDPAFECGGQIALRKAGFVKTDELEATALRQKIYSSDLLNILLDFEEIIAVRNLLLRTYDEDGTARGQAEPWTLAIPAGKQAVLNTNFSKFLFFKDQIPYTPKPTETAETLHYLRMQQQQAAYVAPNQQLPMPEGRYRDLHQYFPVQDDMPQTYGVGKGRLPLDVPPARLAQAKQLKAYLLFFEQVLADFLVQLQHAKWLLSPEDITQTYFTQFLDEPVITRLEAAFAEEFYTATGGTPHLADPSVRRGLYETEGDFVARRNQLLDHLLARFAEQFTDYTLLLYRLKGDRIQSDRDLIGDKTAFLRQYPLVSRGRGQAFNYRPEDTSLLWDSDNISGLTRRLGLLTGIQDLSLRDLYCTAAGQALARTQKVAGQDQYVIVLKDADNFQLFRSVETFGEQPAAQAVADSLSMHLRSPGIYEYDEDTDRLLIRVDDVELTHRDTFDSRSAAELRIRSILRAYDRQLWEQEACSAESQEGFYLIEHHLLRPLFRATDRALLPVCLDEDCEHCGEEDPYSFRMTIVLPYWPGRFRDMDFRRYFERLAREEAPAHMQLKLCWVSNRQLQLVGDRWRAFLQLKSQTEPDPLAYNLALRDLVAILGQLETIQPEAHLHDCEEDGGEIPVRLGYTNLGNY